MLAAVAISAAPLLYGKIGLQIGWGRDKTELALPPGVQLQELHLPRDDQGSPLPHLVDGFDACLGKPRHRSNSQEFIQRALGKVKRKHDGLLQLVEEVAEFDPMAALNLLRASGVNNRFGHIMMSAVPPLVCAEFCRGRDEAVLATFTEIQRFAPDPLTSTHHFPINLGGAGLDSRLMLGRLWTYSHSRLFSPLPGDYEYHSSTGTSTVHSACLSPTQAVRYSGTVLVLVQSAYSYSPGTRGQQGHGTVDRETTQHDHDTTQAISSNGE